MGCPDNAVCVPGCPQAQFDSKGRPVQCRLVTRVRDAAVVSDMAGNREFSIIANNTDEKNIERCKATSVAPINSMSHIGQGGGRRHRS